MCPRAQGYEQLSEKQKEDARGQHMLIKGRWFWRIQETAMACSFRTKPPKKFPADKYSVCPGDKDDTCKVWTPLPVEDGSRGLPAPDGRELLL
jgi:hypothetical protein